LTLTPTSAGDKHEYAKSGENAVERLDASRTELTGGVLRLTRPGPRPVEPRKVLPDALDFLTEKVLAGGDVRPLRLVLGLATG
jgi:hypothetical protein